MVNVISEVVNEMVVDVEFIIMDIMEWIYFNFYLISYYIYKKSIKKFF